MKVESSSVRNILFIQTAFLGDVLLTIPALNELKSKYPQAVISLVCRTGLGSLMQRLGVVQDFYEVEKGNSASYKSVLKRLSTKTFDLLITPHESLRTSIFAARLRAKSKVGPKSFLNSLIFQHRIEKTKWLPEPLRVLEFCGRGDLKTLNAEDLFRLEDEHLSFDTEMASMSRRSQIMQWNDYHSMSVKYPENKKRILVFPGSVWETKRYPLDGFFHTVQSLVKLGYDVVLMGAKNEAPLGEEILKRLAQDAVPAGKVENLIGKTNLIESLCLMALSGTVIGNDSGSAHLAAVAECPSLTIFGPTVLEFGYRPWSNQSWIVQTKKKLDCRPCGSHGHKECPIGTHECMKSIGADDVIETFLKIHS